jgi:uncharacterized protein YjbJ (UPF0337 family)
MLRPIDNSRKVQKLKETRGLRCADTVFAVCGTGLATVRAGTERQSLPDVNGNLKDWTPPSNLKIIRGDKVMYNKEELKGKGNQVIGKVKEKAGELLDDKQLETEGEAQNLKGRIQEKAGTVRRKAGEAVEEIGRAIGGK